MTASAYHGSMVEPLVVVAILVVLAIIAFAVLKKLFKLAVIVAVVALGVWLGLRLFEGMG